MSRARTYPKRRRRSIFPRDEPADNWPDFLEKRHFQYPLSQKRLPTQGRHRDKALARRSKAEFVHFRGSCTDEKSLTARNELLEDVSRRYIRDHVRRSLWRTYVVDETTNTAHERGTLERGTAHAESSATGTHRGPRCPARKRHRRADDIRNAQGAFERHLCRLEIG